MIKKPPVDFSSSFRHPEVASLIVPGAGISPVQCETVDGNEVVRPSVPSDTTINAGLTAAHVITDTSVTAAFFTGDASGYNEPGRVYSSTEKEEMLEIVRFNLPTALFEVVDLRLDPKVSTTSFENIVNAEDFVEEYRASGPIGIVGLKGHVARMRMMANKRFGRSAEFAPINIAHSNYSVREVALTGLYWAAFLGSRPAGMNARHDRLQRTVLAPIKRHSKEEYYS